MQRNCAPSDITLQPCPLLNETTKSLTGNFWESYALFAIDHIYSEKHPSLLLFGLITVISPIGVNPIRLAHVLRPGK